MNIKKKGVLVTAFSIIIAVALLSTIVLYSNTIANAEDSKEYPVNENGLTYGSAANAGDPDREPDLILVAATNGEEGYVYKEDLDAASGMTETPEEAVRLTENRMKQEKEVFAAILAQELEAYDLTISPEKMEEIYVSMAAQEIGDATDLLLSASAESNTSKTQQRGAPFSEAHCESLLINSYPSALTELKTPIPVYKKDGVTEVGVFLVG